ncbi:MAG: hypothetical protein AAGI63_09895, partial [Planctomycetota bacterium]
MFSLRLTYAACLLLTAWPIARAEDPVRSDVMTYNQSVEQFEQKDFEAAAAGFRAVANSSNTALAARSRFNLGNTLYAQALQTMETSDAPPEAENASPSDEQVEQAVGRLGQAITQFRSALRLNPNDDDARANIELAGQL